MASDANSSDHVEAIAPLLTNTDDKTMDDSYQKLSRDKSNDQNGSGNLNIEQATHVIHNKLGTINGCYVPCLLNIMGIILFERLGWGIGQQGVSGVLLSIHPFHPVLTIILRFCDSHSLCMI